MEIYFQIAKSNLWHNLFVHIVIAFLFLLISPCFMGMKNLDAASTAKVLEMYVALIGIILLTPISLPEQNKEIRNLIEAKYTPSALVTIIRLFEAFFTMVLMIGIFIIILKNNNCIIPMGNYFLGTLAGAVFLGGVGFFAYSVFDQIAIAYMLPMVFYIINFGGGKKIAKDFYLFSMGYASYDEKVTLAITGSILIIAGVCYPIVRSRIFPRLLS